MISKPMEGRDGCRRGLLEGHPLSHLFFAEDVLLFAQTKRSRGRVIPKVLH